ncbi:hypothetical protein ACI65C_004956 [Semiaphis heraclei]
MDKWIVKKPKLDVENRDQHDRDHNNEPNYEKSEINEISSCLNESAPSTSTQIHSQTYDYDIGVYVEKTCTNDEKRNDHLLRIEAMPSNRSTSYTSPKIQNELIEICGKVILNKIVSKCNEAECFSLLADETTDISGIEQFSLCVR